MSHHHYDTEGFVLGHLDIKESSRLLYLLTADFGLVLALAQGAREPRSKMRANLQDFSLLRVGLVRGKEFWRLTSAMEFGWFSKILVDAETRVWVAKIFSLLRRLVQGEVKDQELFLIIKNSFLAPTRDANYELTLMARILAHLGYLRKADLKRSPPELFQAVNQALVSSQL
ncbi:MAG: DNA repair protein RecO [Patescibacteria group bacterium]